ncbi:sulfatase-like hydrolase/transferase [Pelagicoccus mobilis]|uniref:Sulfatase-like hydrolase/transferase n=1 Tax=Pelagicoccus mobilis TaxID=415221 RepID=A0A934RSH7_9BACT|nr:sulfatase-like hydrolase/transferase [Pelagicoccus mobilis]MBK1875561.1 sulfatase-like hydrolase/transferase [Pelagicoccus mobilis]
MNSHPHALQLLLATLALLVSPLCSAEQTNSKPNVVLILVDDYGYADISAEGNTQVQTPNIDRIANEGMRLTRFYQSAGACAPTRASLLTGRYYYETGVWGVHWGRDSLHRDENTLGNLMQSAGYKTGVFGKWHSGKSDAYFGWSRGFDTSVHTELYKYHRNRILTDRRIVTVTDPITDVVGDRAAAFIEANKDQPFFCYVPFQAMHEPFNCPEPIFEKYKQQGYSDHVAALYGMVEVLDNNVGKLLDELEEHGLSDNTLVLFMVDDGSSPGFLHTYQTRRMNAEEKAERRRGWARELRGTKANISEGGQISPFYARWPGVIEAGTSSDALSSIIDIYPTLADISNIPYPETQLPLRGFSLKSVLAGGKSLDEDRVLFDGTNLYLLERERSFKDGTPRIRQLSAHYRNWKYIREDNYIHGGTDEHFHKLYNLDTDPNETTDCFAEQAEIGNLLKAHTQTWLDSIIESGRGFEETVIPVGDWNETGTPIHLDATTRIVGPLERPGSGFEFTGWTEIGSALSFNVDVLETGTYRFELDHSESDSGAIFQITAGSASSDCQIGSGKQSYSDPVKLKAGAQQLTITLKDPGSSKDPLDRLKHLVVHCIPDSDTIDIPTGIGFTLSKAKKSKPIAKAVQTFECREFQRSSGNVPTVTVGKAQELTVAPSVDNPESLSRIDVWLGFEKIHSSTIPQTLSLPKLAEGHHTLTLEFISREGTHSTSRVEIDVEG